MKKNKGKIQMDNKKKIVVTSALPYANGDIHLGHLVETVQTDIFVRYKKMSGYDAIYVCADDTHGTPIQITALKRGISCEELIEEAWKNHVRDYAGFSINFDIFYSTNSPENRKWSEYIFEKLKEKELIVEKEIEQYFCENCKRFLPDRFIRGNCPQCSTEDQYGDVCEACGATYDTVDLKNPRCATCSNVPVLRRSTHFFVKLSKEESFLREYLSKGNMLQEDMYNFVIQWVNDGLKEWCISRDGPYFGFKIPDSDNKYFYVWLDAPIGYIASTEKWCKENNRNLEELWNRDAQSEVVHFIGKDIVYFHTLFWPVMLHAASLKTPSKVHVHGFLTIEGEKMSKSRGTFILASEYMEKVRHPNSREYLRFYYGSKLTNNSADIDLNLNEFCNKVNTTLCNNFGNLHHRTFVFLDRYFNSHVPDTHWDEEIAEIVEKAAAEIKNYFENVEFKLVIEKIQAISSIGNKYYQDMKPWDLIKNDKERAAGVMVTCINIVKACAVFLKPFIPNVISTLETQYNTSFQWNDYTFSLRNHSMGKTEKIVIPINRSDFNELLGVSENRQMEKTGRPEKGPLIDIEDFKKIDIRIGVIKKVENIEKSDKLLKISLDDGKKIRTIISGVKRNYQAEDLIGKSTAFIANLKPVKIMGYRSEGMLLTAMKGEKMALLKPDAPIDAGAFVS
ncbi:MAG: methionine--tRNA ligase [Chitinispirillia bacterium]